MTFQAQNARETVIVVGAGIGGLAAALELVAAGRPVHVLEAQDVPGGRIRQVPSAAGGVDTGPTVLTMRHVFDRLFELAGERLEDRVTLHRQDILARHWWPGSGPLDLYADHDRSADAIEAFAGRAERDAFDAFHEKTARLFTAFQAPFIEAAEPSVMQLGARALSEPTPLPALLPGLTMARALRLQFRDPRLRQLFGRYATYVGGAPFHAPALLTLIWQAEAGGVWTVEGGMTALVGALARAIEAKGGIVETGAAVARILTDSTGVTGVVLENGRTVPGRHVVFNGDPRALATGLLGPQTAHVAPHTRDAARSLSAHVWAFAATPSGADLTHHNVFFAGDEAQDFGALDKGCLPPDTTLYVCAQDRGFGRPPPAMERFEIILNAPPKDTQASDPEREFDRCLQRTFPALARYGLSFSPSPTAAALTTPTAFAARFPATKGSLYGQSPHGMTASLRRPRAQTPVPGLWLAGGGCHPGAGVPMAALSGRHAAAGILTARTSTSKSARTATPGGMSTRSRLAAPGRSRSSPS
jgi:1-hydroxycarotenoid 3,4-desaturase